MKKLIMLMFLTYPALCCFGDSLRTELENLVKDRQKIFEEYTASLSKKSGIFGNKTKGDLKDSQEKLTEIIAIDNRIMNSLKRTLDFRTYEKQNMSFDASAYTQRIKNLTALNESVTRQNSFLADEVRRLKSEMKSYRLLTIIFIISLIIAAGLFIYNKFRR